MTPRTFTIGFTKKSAEAFFTGLAEAGVRRLLDVRLKNNSQLAGFAKREDLAWFLKAIADIDYLHVPEFAPTDPMLSTYKKHGGSWEVYEQEFLALMAQRHIETQFTPDFLDGACLLCSEATPEQCHRRLVVEYLAGHWGEIDVRHLT
jgi:uncharacterized protein (DUF488 family)